MPWCQAIAYSILGFLTDRCTFTYNTTHNTGTFCMPDYLTKRHGHWHYVRRVPLEFATLDPRGFVQQSTKIAVGNDKHARKAGRVADAINRELEAYWRGLSEGK